VARLVSRKPAFLLQYDHIGTWSQLQQTAGDSRADDPATDDRNPVLGSRHPGKLPATAAVLRRPLSLEVPGDLPPVLTRSRPAHAEVVLTREAAVV
jgi:hypothetical protein